jgi:single-stranded DNA-binding protein
MCLERLVLKCCAVETNCFLPDKSGYGRLKARKWQDADTDRYRTEIIADQMQMLGSRDNGHTDTTQAAPSVRSKVRSVKSKALAAESSEIDPSDIPF